MRPEWWMMNQFPVHTTKPTEKIKGTLDSLRLAVPFQHTEDGDPCVTRQVLILHACRLQHQGGERTGSRETQ